MYKSTLAGLLASFASLASCDFITLDWENVAVSNELSCGSATIDTFPSGVSAPFQGVFFQNNVIVTNTTVTKACPEPQGLGFATSGLNVATNLDFIVQIASDTQYFGNSLSFDVSYIIPDSKKSQIAPGAKFEISLTLTDFGNVFNPTFDFPVVSDGPGPHHVVVNNIALPYLWGAFEGLIWNPRETWNDFPTAVNVNSFFDNIVLETVPPPSTS